MAQRIFEDEKGICTHCIESLPLLLINVVACVRYNTGWWDLDDLDPRISSPMA